MTTPDRRAFLKFVAVGVVNTAAGLATVFAADRWLGAKAYVANAAGLAVGIVIGYQLNRLWTFRGSRGGTNAPLRYLVAFAAAYAINLAILRLALDADLPALPAQGAALAAYSLVFFLLCRVIVFPAEA
jgi:putative flippase GtrA